MHCHVVSLSNAVQSVPMSLCPSVAPSLLIASVSMSGVAWAACRTFKGRVKHDRVQRQCNHFDHKAVQGGADTPKPTEQASGDKQQDATSYCN